MTENDLGMRFDLIAVGEVLVDIQLGELAPGEARHAPVRLRAGGTAVNAAIGAVAVGSTAAVVGRVGDDAAGRLIREELAAAGIEPLLSFDPVFPTGTFAEALVGGRRAVVTDRGATDLLELADLPSIEAGAVLVSGYLLFHERTHEVARAALRAFDATVAGATGGSSAIVDRGKLADVDVLVVNEDEARAVTGLAAEAAALELAGEVGIACVTLGASGALAARGARVERVTGVDHDDALGAGDAFAGRLLAGLAAGHDLAEALAQSSR